ncbi:MAG: HipA domain-containing protein [Campylobacterales bacterium]|nr:HipA domain-containing protein [Campylobacterales bacterium]
MNLKICKDGKEVGTLQYKDEKFSVTYTKEWSEVGYPLSFHIPLGKTTEGKEVSRFISNLLPEGDSLEEISLAIGVSKSNIFALLSRIGSEPTGAFGFVQEECIGKETSFREITTKELNKRAKERREKGLAIWDGKPRASIAGVQQKLPVAKVDGKYGFGEGELVSTHILKFAEPKTNFVLNEFLSLEIGRELGLDIPVVEIIELGGEPVLEVERFDREFKDEKIFRKHIIDSCQMLNLPPDLKYEWPYGHGKDVEGIRTGVSLKALFSSLDRCKIPIIAKQKIIKLTLFNLLIHNSDAHGKNISFFVDEKGIEVAPFYDLLNLKPYEEKYAQDLSMAIGDTYIFEDLVTPDFEDLCEDCNLSIQLLRREFTGFEKKLTNAIEIAIKKIPDFAYDKDFIILYKKILMENQKFLKSRI